MSNISQTNSCRYPFFDVKEFSEDGGFIEGRLCQQFAEDVLCCLQCPMTDWVYPDYFNTITAVANWVGAVGGLCCIFLLLSWACLPVDKTNRHYLSVCLTGAVFLLILGFVIPLAAQPKQCFDDITPHDMYTSATCGASGAFLVLGGWAGVMWAFLRSLSLHLQICWQVVVDRNFMIFAQAAGWGVPIIGLALALKFSGFSFRFGPTCHINHQNSLADFWIPLLLFAGLTVIITFATFGYCVKVYLAALGDNSASTEGSSNLPSYSSSSQSKMMTPRQAYRRVRRVIALQWRGIAIVLIIIADVIFFSSVFVFQDNVIQAVTDDPEIARAWAVCLVQAGGDKDQCLEEAKTLVVNLATVTAVLLMISLNGVWGLFLLGRWSMVRGWAELIGCIPVPSRRANNDFVSVDARYEISKDTSSYEMLSKDTSAVVTPVSAVIKSPPVASLRVASPPLAGRRTPDYFGHTARYHAPTRSYSSPRPPSQQAWQPNNTYAHPNSYEDLNPLGMNRL